MAEIIRASIFIVPILVIAFFAIVMMIKKLIYLCDPNEVLIFSGGKKSGRDGQAIGYRIIKGGRAIRVPIIETVDRMDLTNIIIEVSVKGAYSKHGIPLAVEGVANVKIPGEEPLIHNALERFLGKSRDQVRQIARETLEGNLRGVLATLTPEEVNQDKEAFAVKLAEEAEHDLARIGLTLDTLKIQNVADEVGYLDAIGRIRNAEVQQRALVAEAQAHAETQQVKWQQHMEGELDKIQERVTVARSQNERRIADARSKREALIQEERAIVQADIAQAKAESETQLERIEQIKLKLHADVIKPAEARLEQQRQQAKADAVSIIEQGTATAKVLTDLAAKYRASGDAGRDVLLMQKLLPLLKSVSGTIGELKVDRMTVIGQGKNGASNGADLAGRLIGLSEEVKAATGVDLPKVLQNKLGAGEGRRGDLPAGVSEPPPPPPRG